LVAQSRSLLQATPQLANRHSLPTGQGDAAEQDGASWVTSSPAQFSVIASARPSQQGARARVIAASTDFPPRTLAGRTTQSVYAQTGAPSLHERPDSAFPHPVESGLRPST